MNKNLEIFCCYARNDQPLLLKLKTHLAFLEREGSLRIWHDMDIAPGAEWEEEISKHLNAAHIILLLISPDFMASEYCYSKEMKQAMKQHNAGKARVIPLLLRAIDWEGAPFSKLQALPTNGKFVMSWLNQDEAFLGIAQSIRKVINELLTSPTLELSQGTREYWLKEGDSHIEAKRYIRALTAYEEAIRLNPHYSQAYKFKGDALWYLRRDKDALAAYEEAIRLDPEDGNAYTSKGDVLKKLMNDQEATIAYNQSLTIFDRAIQLDPNNASAYYDKAVVLNRLDRHEEAIIAYEQVIRLEPNNGGAYANMGASLCKLDRDEEALAFFDEAIQLEDDPSLTYFNKSTALKNLGRHKEAQQLLEKTEQLGFVSMDRKYFWS